MRRHKDELAFATDPAATQGPSDAELAALRARIRKTVEDGGTSAQKALLQAIVKEIKADGRGSVVPWFRLPTEQPSGEKVRTLASMAGGEGFEPSNGGSKVRCLTTWRPPNARSLNRPRVPLLGRPTFTSGVPIVPWRF